MTRPHSWWFEGAVWFCSLVYSAVQLITTIRVTGVFWAWVTSMGTCNMTRSVWDIPPVDPSLWWKRKTEKVLWFLCPGCVSCSCLQHVLLCKLLSVHVVVLKDDLGLVFRISSRVILLQVREAPCLELLISIEASKTEYGGLTKHIDNWPKNIILSSEALNRLTRNFTQKPLASECYFFLFPVKEPNQRHIATVLNVPSKILVRSQHSVGQKILQQLL